LPNQNDEDAATGEAGRQFRSEFLNQVTSASALAGGSVRPILLSEFVCWNLSMEFGSGLNGKPQPTRNLARSTDG
jgi:hypothetical protein